MKNFTGGSAKAKTLQLIQELREHITDPIFIYKNVIDPLIVSVLKLVSPEAAALYSAVRNIVYQVVEATNVFTRVSNSLLNGPFIPFLTVSYDISNVKVVAVPTIGLPTVTNVGVQLDADGIPGFSVNLNRNAPLTGDPLKPPVLQSGELQFNNNEPVIVLRGSNFKVQDTIYNQTSDLKVKFQVGNETYLGTVIEWTYLINNQFEVKVSPPSTIALGSARIVLTRSQTEWSGPTESMRVDYNSNPLRLKTDTDYVLSALSFTDQVAVLKKPIPGHNSSEELVARRARR